MKVRAYTPADYGQLADWWVGRGHAVVVSQALPETGAVAELPDGTLVAAAFLYLTNTSLAYLAWVVTNPDVRPRKFAYVGVNSVITHLVELAQQLDYQTVISTSNSRGLSRILKKAGMVDAGKHDLFVRVKE
jgi:hypothetical protein